MKELNDQKTETAKRRKRKAKSKHGEKSSTKGRPGGDQKLVHSYGPEPKDEGTPTRTRKGQSRKILSDTGCEMSSAGKKPCKCGSLDHSQTSHHDCPLNKHSVTADASCTPVVTIADSGDGSNTANDASCTPVVTTADSGDEVALLMCL